MTRVALALAFAILPLATSCSVDDVDHEGKLCNADAPCPGSYSCTNGACCTPRFSVQSFSVDWKTPNTLRFSWTPPENAKDDFVKYVLVVAKSDAELQAKLAQALANGDDGVGGAIRTAEDSPELGEYDLRLSAGSDEVSATNADQLDPATEYRARLLSFDSAGCAASTQTVVARTDQDSSLSFVLFDESAHPGGEPRPYGAATLVTNAGSAFQGDTYIEWPGSNIEGEYELIGIAALNATLNGNFPSLDFSTAFVEAAVAFEGNPLAAWGEARVLLGPATGGCDGVEAFQLSPYAFRAGDDYRVIQIPLAQLSFEGNNMTADDLATRAVCEVSVGQTFAAGQGARVDEVRLRW